MAAARRSDHSMDDHAASGVKLFAAAADRNKEPILAVLREWLPSPAGIKHALEVASGTGQHVAHFAAALQGWTWQPTEADAACLPSIAAHTAGLGNVAEPLVLDVAATPPADWPQAPGGDGWAAIYAANLCHISPLSAMAGLVSGAGATLRPAGRLLLYGPFAVDGAPATPSDAAFDASLRARDPTWGYRDIEAEVVPAAAAAGLAHLATVAMPANNFTLVFEKE